MYKTNMQKLKNAAAFTDIYKDCSHDIYLREARCVDFQLKNILEPVDETDVIAGRMEHDFVGFSSQYGGIYTYYFNEYAFKKAYEECYADLSEAERFQLEAIEAFWVRENTAQKLKIRFAEEHGCELGNSYKSHGFYNADCRVAGTNLDFHKLMEKGFDGLDAEIDAAAKKNGEKPFYAALKQWIESLRDACAMYRDNARDMAAKHPEHKERFEAMAEALDHIRHNPPATLLEGVQLMWLYSVSCDLMNYSRADDYLGDLYVNDLKAGRLTEEQAVEIVLGLYKHFKEIDKVHDCRVIIGGRGRKNPEAADQLAIVFMEASRRFKETVPQLTLRYYKGMDEQVFQKAMQVNGEGCTFPIIYSDETNIPAVCKVYDVPEKEAEQYVPFGCGEYVLVGLSTGTPNNGVNLLKALEITLHNGWDPYFKVQCGLKTGAPDTFDSFEKLYDALLEQLKGPVELLAAHKRMNYRIAGEEAPYLHQSLLMDDCIDKGLALLEGGVRYLNASSEVFGIISGADSLSAIKKLVYDDKVMTLSQLVHILDCNFEGFEDERKMMLGAPKYGNDDDYADAIATKLFADMSDLTMAAGEKAGLHKYSIVSVNNSMSAEWGNFCEASACGRYRGSALANANGASIGADKNGITALLNSMSKFDSSKHVGVINNIRFTKELFTGSQAKVEMLLKAFYETGGVQTNICVIGKDDLEQAMAHPENYQNLLVRIGGFSARFVTLHPVVQREIIARTTYGG